MTTTKYNAAEQTAAGYADATGHKAMQSTDPNYREGYYAGLGAYANDRAAKLILRKLYAKTDMVGGDILWNAQHYLGDRAHYERIKKISKITFDMYSSIEYI